MESVVKWAEYSTYTLTPYCDPMFADMPYVSQHCSKSSSFGTHHLLLLTCSASFRVYYSAGQPVRKALRGAAKTHASWRKKRSIEMQAAAAAANDEEGNGVRVMAWKKKMLGGRCYIGS